MTSNQVLGNWSQCLICLQRTESTPNCSEKFDIEQRQLSVIYLVNKLLEIPSEVCANYLSNFGNPEEWISICADCSSFVDEGRQLFDKIQALRQRHKAIGVGIRLKMKVKWELEEDDDEGLLLGHGASEIRCYLDMLDSLAEDEEHFPNQSISNLDVDFSLEAIENPTKRKRGRPRKGEKLKIEQIQTNLEFEAEEFQSREEIEDELLENEMDIEAQDFDNSNNEKEFERSDEMMKPKAKDSKPKYPQKKHKKCIYSTTRKKANREKRMLYAAKGDEKRQEEQALSDDGHAYHSDENEVNDQDFQPTSEPESHSDNQVNVGKNAKKKVRAKRQTRRKSKKTKANHQMNDTATDPLEKAIRTKAGNIIQLVHKKIRTPFVTTVPVIMEGAKCEECGKILADVKGLEYHHINKHVDPEASRCGGCAQIFRSPYIFKSHYHKSLNSDPSSPCALQPVFKCDFQACRAVCPSQAALDVHKKINHLDRPAPFYKCLVTGCDFLAFRKGHLTRHIKLKHDTETPKFSCPKPTCSSSFRLETELKKHVRDIHDAKEQGRKFQCHICPSAFYLRLKLQRHLKIHNPDNPCVCETCGKGFKMQNYLTIHSWQHDPAMRHKYKEYRDNKLAKKRRLEQEQLENQTVAV